MGHYDEAIKYLKQALSMRSDAEISAHLGEVLWVSGDKTTARTVWRHALESTPDNESLLGIIKKYSDKIISYKIVAWNSFSFVRISTLAVPAFMILCI